MLVVFEGLILSFWLLLICVVGIAKDGPVGLVVFYEQEVQDKKQKADRSISMDIACERYYIIRREIIVV